MFFACFLGSLSWYRLPRICNSLELGLLMLYCVCQVWACSCSMLHGICYMLACACMCAFQFEWYFYILALCYMLVVQTSMWVSLIKVSLGFHLRFPGVSFRVSCGFLSRFLEGFFWESFRIHFGFHLGFLQGFI